MKQNKNLDLLDAPIILGEPGGVASELLDTVEKFTIFVKNHWISFLKNMEKFKSKENFRIIYQYKKMSNEKFLYLDRNSVKI